MQQPVLYYIKLTYIMLDMPSLTLTLFLEQ